MNFDVFVRIGFFVGRGVGWYYWMDVLVCIFYRYGDVVFYLFLVVGEFFVLVDDVLDGYISKEGGI